MGWSRGGVPTSSPAPVAPRCAATGLDLGPPPRGGQRCRRCPILSGDPIRHPLSVEGPGPLTCGEQTIRGHFYLGRLGDIPILR